MPDGFQPGQEQPGTAEQQINTEISLGQVGRAIAGSFGEQYHHQSGGGGAGGHYEFTSLADLDGIITELKTVRDDIGADGEALDQAIGFIEPPAKDIMSQMQAQATVDSLTAAREHNGRMLAAANAEIVKLESARKAYANAEDTNAASFRKRG